MALFPETVIASEGSYKIIPEFKTIITDMESGTEQRRQKWFFPKYNVELGFGMLTESEMQEVWNFFIARRGAAEAFYFYTYEETLSWTNLYLGVGNGASVIFDLPGKSTSLRTVYVDGISNEALTFLTGGGTEYADRVQFDTPPEAGTILSCDFTGKMRIRCRFEEDKFSRENLFYTLTKASVKLKGLQG